MSRENVETVRRAYDEFFMRGELPFELSHPDIRIDNIPHSPTPGPYFGYEGLRRWRDDITDVAPGVRIQLDEAMDIGDDRVLAMIRFLGHELVEQLPSWAAVHWFSNGLVVRVAGYMTKEEALEGAGLRE